jgi:microcystin-dependent protein
LFYDKLNIFDAVILDHRKETHMSDPYLSEIRMFGGNFAPLGWALCNGAMLNIAENDALYALLGTTYGGDGQTTFAVPDLCSRIPIHMGTNPTIGTTYPLGQAGGSEMVTLTTPQLPAHSHQAVAVAGSGNQVGPQGALWAGSALNQFTTDAPNAAMAPNAVSAAGGSQPHDNMMPSLTINFIICTSGIYPSQN